MLLPGLVMIATFMFYPIIKMFIMSFFDWKIGINQVSVFTGFDNYQAVFNGSDSGNCNYQYLVLRACDRTIPK